MNAIVSADQSTAQVAKQALCEGYTLAAEMARGIAKQIEQRDLPEMDGPSALRVLACALDGAVNNVSPNLKDFQTCAVVVGRTTNRALVEERFPGWRIIQVGSSVIGMRFDRIVVAFCPSRSETEWEAHARWLDEMARTRQPPGRELEWLFPWR